MSALQAMKPALAAAMHELTELTSPRSPINKNLARSGLGTVSCHCGLSLVLATAMLLLAGGRLALNARSEPAVVLPSPAAPCTTSGCESSVQNHETRLLEVNVEAGHVAFVSTSTDKQSPQSQFQGNIGVSGTALSIDLNYASTTAKGDPVSRKFRMKILSLSEFVDADGVLGYNPLTDATGKVWTFKPLFVHCDSLPASWTTENSSPVQSFECASLDGVFALIGHISGAAFGSAAGVVTPLSIKFEVAINSTSFKYLLSNSQLALTASLIADANVHMIDEAGVDISAVGGMHARSVVLNAATGPSGFLSWTPAASVNGGAESAPVVASPLVADPNVAVQVAGQQSRLLTYAFQSTQPKSIVWDPMIGLEGDSSNTSSALNHQPTILLITALLAVAFAMQ